MSTTSLRQRLSWLFIAAIVPLASVAIFQTVIFSGSLRDQTARGLSERARAMVATLDREQERTQAGLASLAVWLDIDDLPRFHAHAAKTAVALDIDSIFLLAPDKHILLSTRTAYGVDLPTLRESPLLDAMRRTGKAGVENLFKGPLSGRMLVAAGVPVLDSGAFKYALIGTHKPEKLQDLLLQQRLPATWRASIVDRNNRIVARTHDMRRYLGAAVPAELMAGLQGREGSFRGTTVDGIPALFAFARSEKTGWIVVIGIPMSEVWLPELAKLGAVSGFLALVVGCAMWGLFRVRREVGRDMSALAGLARSIGEREQASCPDLRFTDLGEVAHVLVDVADSLRSETLRRAAIETSLRESESDLAQAQRLAGVGSWRWMIHTGDVHWSAEMYRLVGRPESAGPARIDEVPGYFTAESWIGLQAAIGRALQTAQPYECEAVVQRADGELISVRSCGEPVFSADGTVIGLRGTTQDVTEQINNAELRRREALARHQALHDPLTGLANRTLVDNRIAHALLRARRDRHQCALLYLDLDGFKPINDTLGHAAGDFVLMEIAARLTQGVRQSDTVGRTGGDEFVILLENVESPDACMRIAASLKHALSLAVPVSAASVHVGVSIGIATFPDDGEAASELMEAADAAMYRAKRQGGNRVELANWTGESADAGRERAVAI